MWTVYCIYKRGKNLETLLLDLTKDGGVSTGSFHAMNLGLHVNDIAENVHENRRILANKLQNH